MMPYAPEAEKAVLGCMLINQESVSIAIQKLSSESFEKKNSLIFKNMERLFNNNENIDYVSLGNELEKNNELELVGGYHYLTGLANNAPSAESVDYYANIVKEYEIKRRIIEVSQKINDEAYESKEDANNILDKAEQILFDISKDVQKGKFREIEPILHEVLDSWGNRKSGVLTGVPSGFYDLDNLLSGFQNSDFIVLAGRPSMGKTALALNFSRNAALDHDIKIGFFSLEMSSKQLVERLITSESKIDSHLVRTGKLPKHEWKKLSNSANNLSESSLFIDDTADLNIMELRAKARQLKAEKDIDIIFIDYIQLLHAPNHESRQQEISYISRSLKALAKELNIPVVALSQLSRAVESRTDHRPIMSDLRESGAIEQDADVVLFVYRKYVYSKNEEDEGLGEIIVSKHRNGPTGLVKVTFVDKYARFMNMDYSSSDSNYQNIPN
ncbi:MAG: replicative DNA helicase [Candidatus Marinimicrobia bacterium]|nr:replicative DNA helicase [Candidatus Neomarinimicrobiota bacterium]